VKPMTKEEIRSLVVPLDRLARAQLADAVRAAQAQMLRAVAGELIHSAAYAGGGQPVCSKRNAITFKSAALVVAQMLAELNTRDAAAQLVLDVLAEPPAEGSL
jgi:hypothetical protein